MKSHGRTTCEARGAKLLIDELATGLALLDADGKQGRIQCGADGFESGWVLRRGEFVKGKRHHANVSGFDADPLIESLRGAELVWGLRDLGVAGRGNQKGERALIVNHPPAKSGRQ